LNQFGGERRKAVELIIRRAILNDHVAAFGEAGIFKALDKSFGRCSGGTGPHAQPTNDGKLGLRARRERPTCCAPEKGDEIASPQYRLPSLRTEA
jgi:hypothetical protein